MNSTHALAFHKPGIIPTQDSLPYAGVTYRYAHNCLTYEEQEAICWLEEYFQVRRGDLLLQRHYFGEISVYLKQSQLKYGPIIEEFFWELGIPLLDRSPWYRMVFPNSSYLDEMILSYKTNTIGLVNEEV